MFNFRKKSNRQKHRDPNINKEFRPPPSKSVLNVRSKPGRQESVPEKLEKIQQWEDLFNGKNRLWWESQLL